jgi:hypothetical protein
LEVFFDAFRLAEQEGYMLVRSIQETFEHGDRLFKFLNEMFVFLIAPRIAEGEELAVHGREVRLHFGIESFQSVGEAPQLGGINDR